MATYKVAILTVSDTASTDAQQDRSGPAIRDILTDHNSGCQFSVDAPVIVPDNVGLIQSTVKGWSIGGLYDWIITTGGTGFGPRDLTPEAISPLIERPAPGLVHLIVAESLKHTPLAALSRPVVGSIRNTLITTLPGSPKAVKENLPKAVKENLSALLQGGVISHALDLLTGGKESGQSGHSRIITTTTITTSIINTGTKFLLLEHYLTIPTSLRNRVSPYRLVSMDEAMRLVLEVSKPLEPVTLDPLEPVTLDVNSRLAGHVLSEDVTAPHALPATPTTNVDGYAVQVPYKKGTFKVLTPATLRLGSEVPPDSVYRINTGAPLPPGANAVIMVEDTQVGSQFSAEEGEEGEEKTVELPQHRGTWGTSMGASDLLKPLLERNLKGTIHFGRVAMKPGKPTTFASVPSANGGREKLVFGLPGNPASALVTFYLFVFPALRRLGGWTPEAAELPRVPVELTESLPLDPRPEFHRVHVRITSSGLKAFSTGGQRSSRVASLAGANGLVALPALVEGGPKVLEKGQIAKVVLIGELQT
ncbi:hypothetical protein RSAG8_03092, partial [Rhizoctonia solani AG-8 WAC10335]